MNFDTTGLRFCGHVTRWFKVGRSCYIESNPIGNKVFNLVTLNGDDIYVRDFDNPTVQRDITMIAVGEVDEFVGYIVLTPNGYIFPTKNCVRFHD